MELSVVSQPQKLPSAGSSLTGGFTKSSGIAAREASPSYFVRRLAHGAGPDHPLQRALDDLLQGKLRIIAKRGDLLREGDWIEHLYIVVDGWGCRYKSTSDGVRQIIGFLIPGDICNPEHIHDVRSSYAVGAITQLTVAACRLDAVESVIQREGRIARLIWSDVAKMSDRERIWLLNIGQRDAMISVSHLLCELIERLDCVGMLHDGACLFPITQHDIAAATGLSDVHINRTLGELRRRGFISFKGRALAVTDRARLEDYCLFESSALHRSFKTLR